MRILGSIFLIFMFVVAEPLGLSGATSPGEVAVEASALSLMPVKTDNPRDTLLSFMSMMDRHVLALRSGDRQAQIWLDNAVRCLDLSATNPIGRETVGQESARYLKEVIDRVISIDYDKVPANTDQVRWRLRGTEIAMHRIESGDRTGEFLFTPDTVARTKDFFIRVREMPLHKDALGGGFYVPWHEDFMPKGLRKELFGVAYWQWLLITILIFIGLVLRQLVRGLGYLAKQAAARTEVSWDNDLVEALIGPVTHLGTTAIWFASLNLIGITGTAYTVIAFLIKGAFFVNLTYMAYNLSGFVGSLLEQRIQQSHKGINQGLLRLLKQTLRILAIVFCLLLGAQNMGLDVASLIAGLGIGGLAFALAAKDTLANLFGSVMIMLDRPFRIGDYIIAKGVEGTVEEVGFRSTRVRTLANSLASVPNSELMMATIDNLGMREYRRVSETYSLAYGTLPAQIDDFCEGVRSILRARAEVKQDAIVVQFCTMGASSLDVLVNYHLKVSEWEEELSVRNAVLNQVLSLAGRIPVSFAFPTQTLHIESLPKSP